jgi:hypothetical protein
MPMVIIPHISVYYIIRCDLLFTVFYMHAFHKLIIFIILSLITHFHKIEFTVIKYISCEL